MTGFHSLIIDGKLRRGLFIGAITLFAAMPIGGSINALAQMKNNGMYQGGMHQGAMHKGGMYRHGMRQGGMHGHGSDGTGHDEVNMPGLRGLDATPEESAELAEMFRNFSQISRQVENLPNGIKTVTYSVDDELMSTVTSHVVGMLNRVEEGRDPQIFIQSPTLDILFEKRELISTEIEQTEEGIVVIQTSDDPDVVRALQIHAGEVSDMVDRGMAAVHEMMMKRAEN